MSEEVLVMAEKLHVLIKDTCKKHLIKIGDNDAEIIARAIALALKTETR